MRNWWCLCVIAGALGACADPGPDPVIALAAGTSGLLDVQLAQDLVDRDGPSGLTFINDPLAEGTDTESELHRAVRFLEIEGLVGVVGHPGSRASLVAAPLYNDAGVVQIVPTGTSRGLADAGPWTFTLAPNDSIEGAVIGRFVADTLGARRVLLFFLTDEYGYGLRDGVVAELGRRGVEIVDAVPLRPSYQLADSRDGNLESLVEAALQRGKPDAVVLATRDYAARIIVPLIAPRFPDLSFVAGDGVLLAGNDRKELGEFLDRIHLTVFWHLGAGNDPENAFADMYREASGVYPTHDHVLFHDGLMLLATAVAEVGPRPDRVRDYLLSLGGDRPSYPGVSGAISFGTNRQHPVFIVPALEPIGG